MKTLTVALGARSYPINIGQGLLSDPFWASYCTGDNVLVVTDKNVSPHYLQKVLHNLSDKNVKFIELPSGEIEKNLDNYIKILDFLISHSFRRNDTLISLGGGVIGDLGGFVAASYQRGMNFIQIPTTLLSQVDSSVGGKTAVNHTKGKNLIGAFYQPKIVIIDTDTLDTLEKREFSSGLAEVAKYALLGNQKLFALLMNNAPEILKKNKDLLHQIIYLCCEQKSNVVAEDEIESGSRALLNLGHTFGHAIEKLTEYKHFLHGEAVAIGMQMAFNLSVLLQKISNKDAKKCQQLLQILSLPNELNMDISAEEILNSMRLDKKNTSAAFRLILPNQLGCEIVEVTDEDMIKKAINM